MLHEQLKIIDKSGETSLLEIDQSRLKFIGSDGISQWVLLSKKGEVLSIDKDIQVGNTTLSKQIGNADADSEGYLQIKESDTNWVGFKAAGMFISGGMELIGNLGSAGRQNGDLYVNNLHAKTITCSGALEVPKSITADTIEASSSITAERNITSTRGDITAGGNITSTSGNITAKGKIEAKSVTGSGIFGRTIKLNVSPEETGTIHFESTLGEEEDSIISGDGGIINSLNFDVVAGFNSDFNTYANIKITDLEKVSVNLTGSLTQLEIMPKRKNSQFTLDQGKLEIIPKTINSQITLSLGQLEDNQLQKISCGKKIPGGMFIPIDAWARDYRHTGCVPVGYGPTYKFYIKENTTSFSIIEGHKICRFSYNDNEIYDIFIDGERTLRAYLNGREVDENWWDLIFVRGFVLKINV